jgi:hypothetical protein
MSGIAVLFHLEIGRLILKRYLLYLITTYANSPKSMLTRVFRHR